MKAETSSCNISDHVTILQILNAGWCEDKAMDLYFGGTHIRSSPDIGFPEKILHSVPQPRMLLRNFSELKSLLFMGL
jgi:hypothetical protein